MSRNKKLPKPVNLWLPDYYERSPENLFDNEFAVDERAYSAAFNSADWLFGDLLVSDEQAIMERYGNDPAVRVANHCDFSDPPLLGLLYRSHNYARPRYAAMAELFDERRPRTARFIASIGGFPVDRARMLNKEEKVQRQFMKMSGYILSSLREPLDIFPEGGIIKQPDKTRYVVGDLSPGAVMVARRNKVPIIVLGHSGTRHALIKRCLPGNAVDVAVCVQDVFMPEEKVTTEKLRESMQLAADTARDLLQ